MRFAKNSSQKKKDFELDTFTHACLEMICCSCAVVITRQLGKQFTGGKFISPHLKFCKEHVFAREQTFFLKGALP